ncbi:replication initiation factor domain-containing protein [Phycisphaeraceae bacterium D3-23]
MPLAYASRIIRKLDDLFGPGEEGPGLHGRKHGHHWTAGLRVACDDADGNHRDCIVQMPGSFLQPLTMDDKLGLLAYLLSFDGARCTRIDVANDWRGEGIDLVQHVRHACERDELCKARTWSTIAKYNRQTLDGETLAIGQRGKKGSGRYIRLYDKGLEQGTSERGTWVRWEAEFTKGVADQVARDILASAEPIATARGYALGAVEFRTNNGKRIRDRPLCTWWASIVADTTTLRATMPRTKADFTSTCRWLQTQVMPTVQGLADLAGQTIEGFVAKHVGEVCVRLDTLMRKPATHQFLQLAASGD